MVDTTWTVGLASVISVIVYCLVTKSNKKSSLHNAPPCLPSLPIIGSLPFLGGAKNAHISLFNLTKRYGNIYGLYLGSRYYVVLNGYEAIKEALVKNSLAYADRGKLMIDGKVWQDTGRGIALRPYDAELLANRHNSLTVLKSFGYGTRSIMESRIQLEATYLIEQISKLNGEVWQPDKLLQSATLNIIYNLMFAERFSYDGELADFHTSSTRSFAEAADAIYEIFPLLMEVPPYKVLLEKHRDIYINWTNIMEDKVKQIISADSSSDENFITEYVKLVGKSNISTRELAIILRDLITGGTETTSGQLNWALIFLANHPEIQSKLQQEIDLVVERGRLPSLDDKPKLPYLEATILEVMRIRTVVPLIPRLTLSQSKLREYTIPAKTEILVNLWSAHMDPEVWPEPEIFRPERFLDDNGEVTKREMMITFSFGKRSCLGEVLARQEMFLLAAAMIQNFRILPPEGEDKVRDEMCFIRTLTPEPHTLRLIPR